jgi:hypothetical protein
MECPPFVSDALCSLQNTVHSISEVGSFHTNCIICKNVEIFKKTTFGEGKSRIFGNILFFNIKPSILIKLLDRHVFMQARNWCNASQSLVF